MDQIIPMLAAFGLGSVVTALVQSALTNRTKRFDRIFTEKQAAYVGFLEARHRYALEETTEAERSFAYWLNRCDLVGSGAVREAIGQLAATTEDSEGQLKADDNLRVQCDTISRSRIEEILSRQALQTIPNNQRTGARILAGKGIC